MASSSSNPVQGGPDNKTRRARALEFRRAGVSYETIASQLNYSDPAAARWDVAQSLRGAVQDEPEDGVRLELERLDALLLGLWQPARRGDVASAEGILRIIRARVRCLARISRRGHPPERAR